MRSAMAGTRSAPQRVLPFYPAFLAGMNLVVLADDAFTFLVSWEFMSLTSWALVMAHHRDRDNVRAGYVYLVMASFGTLALLLAFGLLAGADGGYAFDAHPRRASLRRRSPRWCLILVLIGAGSKAGLVPLHVWLPLAHPAAPSHVSALMSGVMTKVAVYGFVRIVFDLLGPAGLVVEHGRAGARRHHRGDGRALCADAARSQARCSPITRSRISASSSSALGLALAFQAHGMALAAALALTAGAVPRVQPFACSRACCSSAPARCSTATGERDMEKLGGLIHRMPQTAFVFLVGCVAISALPPLNGFVSEWLTFQAILLSPQLPPWGLKLLVPAVGALAGAVGRAGRRLLRQGVRRDASSAAPRTPAAERAQRDRSASRSPRCSASPRSAWSPASCPAFSSMRWRRWCKASSASRMPVQTGVEWLSIVPIAESRSSYNGLLVFVFMVALRHARGLRDPSACLRHVCAARRPGIAAIPIRARRRNTPPAASPSRSAACSARWCSARARSSTCRRPATCARRGSRRAARSGLGRALCADRAAASISPPSGSIGCSS